MFFKRLSRSRSNSQSYIDNSYSPHDSKGPSDSFDDKYRDDVYDQRPDSSRAPDGPIRANSMFASQAQDQYATPPLSSSGNRPMMNGYNGGSVSNPAISKSQPSGPTEAMPDLLTRAFNEAVRPYTTKLEEMENEVADLRAHIEQLEAQRREVHAWIDKRGLRPGKCSKLMILPAI